MIRGTLCILAFMLIFILSAKGDGAYDHIYNVIEEQRLTSEQQKMFNDFYSNVFQYASDRYGIKKAALGTACIVAYVGYSYGDPAYEYKNIKLKPREELIKFLKAKCVSLKDREVFKEIKDTIRIYHDILSDGTGNIFIRAK